MNIVILGSGKGTNAHAILDAWKKGKLGKAKVKAVLSDISNAPIIKIAESFSVPTKLMGLSTNNSKISSDDAKQLIEMISEFNATIVVLAGFMKILPINFIEFFQGRIVNIHPSLLPSFKGLHAIKRAYERGVKISGCTVHWVSEGIDEGKIIAQSPVRIFETDTLESFTQKIHAAEHYLLPTVIAELSNSNEYRP